MLNHSFSVSFDIVTAESAENGDTADSGYILESAPLDYAIHSVLATESNTIDGRYIHANESNGRIRNTVSKHSRNRHSGI